MEKCDIKYTELMNNHTTTLIFCSSSSETRKTKTILRNLLSHFRRLIGGKLCMKSVVLKSRV